jgi:murein DD-endopeptidase MepM/ murein hydrolase activator NlpD
MSAHARHARHRARRRATHRRLATGAGILGLATASLAGHAYATADAPVPAPAPVGVRPLDPAVQPRPMSVVALDRIAVDEQGAEQVATPVAAPAPPPPPPPPPPPAVVSPVVGGHRITATFGATGRHWSSGRHTGLDFAGATGTPIAAVAAGTVIEAGRSGAYGNRIVVQHDDGTATAYSHLARIAVSGGRVEAGTVIGLLGSTGNSTGPHLHFEATSGGQFIDPRAWLAERGVSV